MNPAGRALLGAALGALATLCIHPVSRPFMMGVTSRASPAVLRNCIDSNSPSIVPPTTLAGASLWMQLAAHRVATREKLSAKERDDVLSIAAAAADKDRMNAFWPEMEAIVHADSDQVPAAVEAWARASNCSTWDDGQTPRLIEDRASMVDFTGVTQSWQMAYLYYSRSEDVADCLVHVARIILAKADYNTVAGLNLRYATLRNADLIRAHAHSSTTSIRAMEIIDLVTYPSDSILAPYGFNPSPKKLELGEDKVVQNLRKIAHQPDWSQAAYQIFRNAVSWRALTVHDSNAEESEWLAVAAVLCSSVASAVVVVSVIGVVVWVLGWLVAWRLAQSKNIKPAVVAAIAIGLGGLVVFLTGYLPAGFAAALCAAFLIVAPDRSRKARPSDLGPLFSFTAMLLGLICSAMFLTYLIGTTPAAKAIFPSLGVPSDYIDRPLLAGLAAVSFSLLLLVAPIWAVVHRLGTPHVLSLILMRFGAFVSVMGLSLSILLGPLSVYADRKLESTFSELVKNEPVHYYINR